MVGSRFAAAFLPLPILAASIVLNRLILILIKFNCSNIHLTIDNHCLDVSNGAAPTISAVLSSEFWFETFFTVLVLMAGA